MEKIKYCKLGYGTDIFCKKEIQLPINCFECLPSYIIWPRRNLAIINIQCKLHLVAVSVCFGSRPVLISYIGLDDHC